jgi:enoyl-CoA hydratase/carnithine racemase
MVPAEPEHFVASYTEGIAWGTFNREGALNAYTPRMRDALIEFLRRAEEDAAIRCVVLKGAGKHFMAGGDVKDFQEHFRKTPTERRAQFESLISRWRASQRFSRLPTSGLEPPRTGAAPSSYRAPSG